MQRNFRFLFRSMALASMHLILIFLISGCKVNKFESRRVAGNMQYTEIPVGGNGSGTNPGAGSGTGGSTTPGTGGVITQPAADGYKLYSTNCAGCHGEISATKIYNPSVDSITLNIANQPAMMGLKSFMTKEYIAAVSAAIVESRSVAAQCATAPDVGFVNIQRMNKKEFDNTLSDLLGITTKYSVDFPPDSVTNGFDNNAQALVITADLANKIYSAAESAVGEVFANATLRSRIYTCDPQLATCVQSTLQSFLPRVFRRPIDSEELTRYTNLVNTVKSKGETGEFGLRVALTAAIASPHFLYRIPVMSNPSPTTVVTLGAYQLASRLSYFLWSTMPDTELFNAAANGSLLRNDQLTLQVKRMLASTKATALVDNFASPWVGLGKVGRVTPDRTLYPTFNETLRADLMNETKFFLSDMFKRDASFFEMLTAKHTFLNDRLASHYGITGITGSNFQKVNITDGKRMGLLTHGSMMAVGANQYYSSIVKRGNLVLSNVLCAPPPPPPAGTSTTITEEQIVEKTRRDILAQHRENPACFSCHIQIDPIGLGFENFDPLGRFQTVDEKNRPLNPASTMPNGKSFTNAVGMINLVAEDPRFRSCVAEKILIYSLGRNVESYDRCTINRIGQGTVDPNKPISSTIIEMVLSDPFRKQRGGGN